MGLDRVVVCQAPHSLPATLHKTHKLTPKQVRQSESDPCRGSAPDCQMMLDHLRHCQDTNQQPAAAVI